MKEVRPFFSHTPEEICQILVEEKGFPPFKAREVLHWVYAKRTLQPKKMTTLSKKDRSVLEDTFRFRLLQVEERQISEDGTQKILFRLPDGETVETVIIPKGKRRTICLSSQVGCPIGCRFCASGLQGLRRHLQPFEIVEQFLHARYFAKAPVTNLVVMGMGEPFLNFQNVWKALSILNHPQGLGFGIRRMTVSTVGLKKLINRVFSTELRPRLALSLHAPTDELRAQLIPFPAILSVSEIVEFAKQYTERKISRLTLEYVMLQGVNTAPSQAHLLGKLFQNLPVRINLIPYNPVPELPYTSPKEREVQHFAVILEGYGIRTTVRQRHGEDIQAACGQLRYRALNLENTPS